MGEANRTANTSRQYIEWFLRTGCLLEKNVAGETLQKICPPADVACLLPGLVPKRCRLLERRCVSSATWSPLARRQDCLPTAWGTTTGEPYWWRVVRYF